MEPPEFTAAKKVIQRWDSSASEEARKKTIFAGDRLEIDLYLDAVDELQKSTSSASVSSTLQIAMSRLEDEFRTILLTHTTPIEDELLTESTHPPELDPGEETAERTLEHQESNSSTCYRSSPSIRELDLISSSAAHDLRRIAERMTAAGHLRDCIQAYASARKPAVDGTLRKLSVERLSIGDIQRLEWEILETKIRRWIRAARICVRVLFASERKLCDQIFEDLGISAATAAESCFFETIKSPATQLFNFAEAISISDRSPEKLFKILDLHDALSDLLPDIESVFDSKSTESIRVEAAEILSRLAEAARGILSEFESAVLREPSRVPVPGGTIHPLTRYVMNYISLISDYKQTLIQLIVSKPSTDTDLSEFESHASTLALHLIWIIVNLQFNLTGKSEHYKDSSLAHLFMMNNVHYIAQKVKSSPELREMIGDGYLKKLTGKFRSSATSYQRSTWVRVLHCLRDEGLHVSGSFSSGVSKSALRERFKSFNAIFDEVHRTQATWLIPDAQLREELRISASELLIPAYRSFLGRFRSYIESGRHPENYIRYSVEDLEDAVMDFFEGSRRRAD